MTNQYLMGDEPGNWHNKLHAIQEGHLKHCLFLQLQSMFTFW